MLSTIGNESGETNWNENVNSPPARPASAAAKTNRRSLIDATGMPDAAADASSAAIACSARPARERTRLIGEQQRHGDEPPDDRRMQRPAQLVPRDLERLRDRDAVLAAAEAVLRIEQAEGDQVQRERREREVVAAQPQQRHADQRGDAAVTNGAARTASTGRCRRSGR